VVAGMKASSRISFFHGRFGFGYFYSITRIWSPVTFLKKNDISAEVLPEEVVPRELARGMVVFLRRSFA